MCAILSLWTFLSRFGVGAPLDREAHRTCYYIFSEFVLCARIEALYRMHTIHIYIYMLL